MENNGTPNERPGIRDEDGTLRDSAGDTAHPVKHIEDLADIAALRQAIEQAHTALQAAAVRHPAIQWQKTIAEGVEHWTAATDIPALRQTLLLIQTLHQIMEAEIDMLLAFTRCLHAYEIEPEHPAYDTAQMLSAHIKTLVEFTEKMVANPLSWNLFRPRVPGMPRRWSQLFRWCLTWLTARPSPEKGNVYMQKARRAVYVNWKAFVKTHYPRPTRTLKLTLTHHAYTIAAFTELTAYLEALADFKTDWEHWERDRTTLCALQATAVQIALHSARAVADLNFFMDYPEKIRTIRENFSEKIACMRILSSMGKTVCAIAQAEHFPPYTGSKIRQLVQQLITHMAEILGNPAVQVVNLHPIFQAIAHILQTMTQPHYHAASIREAIGALIHNVLNRPPEELQVWEAPRKIGRSLLEFIKKETSVRRYNKPLRWQHHAHWKEHSADLTQDLFDLEALFRENDGHD